MFSLISQIFFFILGFVILLIGKYYSKKRNALGHRAIGKGIMILSTIVSLLLILPPLFIWSVQGTIIITKVHLRGVLYSSVVLILAFPLAIMEQKRNAKKEIDDSFGLFALGIMVLGVIIDLTGWAYIITHLPGGY